MADSLARNSPDPGSGRAFEHICERVRMQLASGELRPGDKLPAEREMAEQFAAGRNAVREALRSLEMAGIVRLEKGRNGGAYIRPGNASRVTVVMRDLLDIGSISLDEITESRTMLMDIVSRLACERASTADMDALERNVDETEEATKAGNLEGRAERIAEFYAMLAGTTGNRVLVMMVISLSDIVRRFLASAALRGRPLATLVPARRRFMTQLRARNADAAAAEMRSHLMATHKVIARALQIAGKIEVKADPGDKRLVRRPAAKVSRRAKAPAAAAARQRRTA